MSPNVQAKQCTHCGHIDYCAPGVARACPLCGKQGRDLRLVEGDQVERKKAK